MELVKRNFFGIFQRGFEAVLCQILVAVSGRLQRSSPTRWAKTVAEISKKGGISGGPQGAPRPSIAPYKPDYATTPESQYQQGSWGDIPQQLNNAKQLPDWSREIQPFLHNQLSDHTRRAYESDLKQFFRFLEGKIRPDQIHTLRAEHIILFRKSLEEGRLTGKKMEKSTVNRKLAVVKSFFQWLRLNHVVSENPAQLVKGFPQSQESSLKGLSDEEARKILDKPSRNSRSGALHTAILHMLLFLGLRKGELLQLKMGDLDEERGTPVLKVRGKGHRIRILPLTETLVFHLKHYFFVCQRDATDKEAPLFIPTKNPRTRTLVKPLNPNSISYLVRRYARQVGILKRISPHSCRATCISNALDKRATHRSVQHLAGWSTPLMIQRYDKRREDLRNSAAFAIHYGESAVSK